MRVERFWHALPQDSFFGKRTFAIDIGEKQLERLIVHCDHRFILRSLRIGLDEQLCAPFPACILGDPFARLVLTRRSGPTTITLEIENVGLRVFPKWKNRRRLSRKKWRWLGSYLDVRPMPFPCALVCFDVARR